MYTDTVMSSYDILTNLPSQQLNHLDKGGDVRSINLLDMG
jgi:hypothetical protein